MSNARFPEPLTRASRETLLAILNMLPGALFFLDASGMVVFANASAQALVGATTGEVVGKPLAQILWESGSSADRQQLGAAIARAGRGESTRFEIQVHPREGTPLYLEATITPHQDVDHPIEYLIFSGIDITERKRAETDILALIDAIPQLVWTGRPDGYIDYCNQHWRDYTGMGIEQTRGDGWMQCTHPDDRQRVLQIWRNAVRTGQPYEAEQRLRQGSTGEYRWFLMQATPFKDSRGRILKYVGTCTDIHERKQAEDEIHLLVDAIPHLVWMIRPDGSAEYCNQRLCDYTQMTPEQLQRDGWVQCLHPGDQQRVLEAWRAAVSTGTCYEVEHRLRDGRTGEYRWFLARGMPRRDAQGRVLKWFGTSTDIDNQKRAEQQLKTSEQNFRLLAETVPQLVWTMLPDGRLDYTNQRYRDVTRANLSLEGDDIWRQFVHPDDIERTLKLRRQLLKAGEIYENEYRLLDGRTGTYRWFLTRALPIHDETGQVIKWFGTGTDIDDQKRIEEALRQSQQYVRTLIDSNLIGIVTNEGEEEVIVDANETFLRMSGYSREQIDRRSLTRTAITVPEDAPLFERALQEISERGQHAPIEFELVCQDGSRLPALAGGVLLQKHPRQLIAFVLDNSARKELEQRKDDFLSMASHELKNPLTALKLQTSLLSRQLARQGLQTTAPALSRMETQINQVIRLVEELLDVSKIRAGGLEYREESVELDPLLREVVETMQQTHPSHGIVVHGAVQASLRGDRDRLGQVFSNLLSNAIKYSPGARIVEVDLSASAQTATIRVRDAGLGIPREQQEQIFERFYRTAGSRQKAIPGLGMGLYIVAEIVRHHGGSVGVESAIGKGSTFTVTLPLNSDA